MEKYASLRKKNTGSALWVTIAVLVILECCAVSMLFAQIVTFSSVQKRNYISLTQPSENTKLEISTKAKKAAPTLAPQALTSVTKGLKTSGAGMLHSTGSYAFTTDEIKGEIDKFTVYDENTVWSTHTDIEIFKIKYDNNGDLIYTVNSDVNDDGTQDKVFAPGTGNTYSFTLKNDLDNTSIPGIKGKSLDYTVYVDAWFEGTDYIIPIEAKMYDNEKYLLGSADEWRPVLELDPIEDSGVLSAGKIHDYYLEWQWPFERFDGEGLDANDAYDTMLGNLAASGEELELHIRIYTVAEVTEDEGGDNPPPTGDRGLVPVLAVLAVAVLVIIILLIVEKRKSREEEE